MTDKDAANFFAMMNAIAENHGKIISEEGIALRFEALRHHPWEKVRKAGIELLREHKFSSMPTVAHFVEKLEGSSDIDARAKIAASSLVKAIRHLGGWRSVCFEDRSLMAVVEQLGGWPSTCEKCGVEQDEHWFARDIEQRYAAVLKTGSCPEGVYLPGREEIENEFANHKLETSVHLIRINGERRVYTSIAEFRAELGLGSTKAIAS